MSQLEIITTAERHDLDDEVSAAFRSLWPEFIFHDRVTDTYIGRVETYFPQHDVLVLADGKVVAGGWGVPIRWDGRPASLPSGYDEALAWAVTGYESGIAPDTLCVMAAAVKADHHGSGLAAVVLRALGKRADSAGLRHVICPVRPVLKSRYPLTPMARFARWTRADGLHIDPWIRTHQRLGATIVAPAPRSMVITGSVAEWESWTGMAFPETGDYVVPGALDTVSINRESDEGRYQEPGIWLRHR